MNFLYDATYWVDGEVVRCSTYDWLSLPVTGLLWVTVSWDLCSHTLLGADMYWARGNEYGMVYDGSCCPAGASAWRVTMEGCTKLPNWLPGNVRLIHGQMLPDEQWARIRELGR